MGPDSQFVTFLLSKCSSCEIKENFVPTRTVERVDGPQFRLADVAIELKHRYFFDEEDLLIRPFNGLKEKDKKIPESHFTIMPFWDLYLASKHEHKDHEQIFSSSNLENALCCLGSSYLMLRFISYDLLCSQIGHERTKPEERTLKSFLNNFQKEGVVKTSQNKIAISHSSSKEIYTGPYGGELSGYQGEIKMPSEIFGWYYWTVK